jgi:type IV pilus assembly protein PilY1
MKKILLLILLILISLSPGPAMAAMEDYCVVPPYVVQNVAPNVMLLLDNSHSMLEFAYYDGFATTTTAADATGDATIEVNDVSGFEVGDRIAIYTTQNYWEGWPDNWSLTITAIDSVNNELTVSYGPAVTWLTYGIGAPVILRSRGGTTYPYLPYYAGAVNGIATLTSAAGTDAIEDDAHTFPVTSTAGFAVGDRIAIYTGINWLGGYSTTSYCFAQQMTITAIGAGTITVDYFYDNPYIFYDPGTPIILIQAVGAFSPISNHVPACSWDDYVRAVPADKYYDADFDPSATYDGYFDNGYWYTYTSNRFERADSKTTDPTKDATEWDGNFLNWLTMRRIDIVRKALTGGAPSGSAGADTILGGEIADCGQRGNSYVSGVSNLSVKAVSSSVQSYIPLVLGTGARCFRVNTADDTAPYGCDGSGAGTASFSISTDETCSAFGGATYSVEARTPGDIEGVLQAVVGAKARVGLSFFNESAADDGAYVQTSVGEGSLESTINQINLTRPTADITPLAEALWSVTGYFAQEDSFASIGGSGPRYSPGDYAINALNDPMNYGSGGSPRYPECAANYVVMITDGDPCEDGNMHTSILNHASGESDYNCGTPKPSADECPAVGSFEAQTIPGLPTCSAGNVAGLEDVALWSHTTDLRDTALGTHNIAEDQVLTLYVVHAFGESSTLLQYAAINGGFVDDEVEGDANYGVPDNQSEWDDPDDGDDLPDNFYQASAADLEDNLTDAFNSLLRRAASGTAASVLASGEGTGANLVQAVFYPRRRFGNEVLLWTGTLQNFWYYSDPFFTYSNIREDTSEDQILNLQNDYAAELFFDEASQSARALLYADTDGDGAYEEPEVDEIPLEEVQYLWEAGEKLFYQDADTRTIYANLNGTGFSAFTNALSDPDLRSFMNVPDYDSSGDNIDETIGVIDYIRGQHVEQDTDGISPPNDYRDRVVIYNGISGVWKLGDVLNSTPKIVTFLPINMYDIVYGDDTYGEQDVGGFVNSTTYQNRGAVFAGGNDGMLHVFKLGTLEDEWIGQGDYEKAKITGTEIGNELWAFIPKSVLPYLKYIPDDDYCHIFSVDLSPYIFDASIRKDTGVTHPAGCTDSNYWNCVKTEDSWRTILIGGMRFGGACKPYGTGSGVEVPLQVGGVDIGYSSYFAIDVTDPTNPEFLWEFSDSQLGFTTTGPSIVKINGYEDTNGNGSIDVTDLQSSTANGRWLVMFGSGPTGPIDTTFYQFDGESDQNLRFFVLDLVSGSQITGSPKDTLITNAFAGSMINITDDPDLDYSDDVMYVGYVEEDSALSTWTQGGVVRILTNGDFEDIGNWNFNKVIENTGPVTASVQTLQYEDLNTGTHGYWIYFGTGRYYFAVTDDQDDLYGQRHLVGMKDLCYHDSSTLFNPASCSSLTDPYNQAAAAHLNDATALVNATSSPTYGWFIKTDPAPADPTGCSTDEASADYDENCGYGAERVITDPLSSAIGLAYFTTYKPYDVECGIGGESYLWAVEYSSGGDPSGLLKGTALIQVSTGSIEKVDLSEQFTEKGGRRSASMEGVPPTAQGFSLFLTPPPDEQILQVQEK